MASEAPSWADQWGAGGIGAYDEEENTGTNKDDGNKKKNSSGTALSKANAAAKKLKNGTSTGFKWIKNKCQKKNSDTQNTAKE